MRDTQFGSRLRYLRKLRGLVQTEAASKIGISYKALQNHESGKWPNRNNLEKYINFYGCNRDWLLTGKGQPYPNSDQDPPNIYSLKEPTIPRSEGTVTRESYILIPEVEGRVTAGPEGGLLYDEPADHYPFKKTWILKKFGRDQARHKALVLVRVTGDSMVPTINPGELILVDTWEPERLEIKDGKVYLIRMPDGTITVKRLILNKENGKARLICLSDNPNFEPFKFQVEMPLQWYVLGRIRWVGREID